MACSVAQSRSISAQGCLSVPGALIKTIDKAAVSEDSVEMAVQVEEKRTDVSDETIGVNKRDARRCKKRGCKKKGIKVTYPSLL